jgi:hypothetical protein
LTAPAPLRVGVASQPIAWIGIAFFAFCAVASWQAGQGSVTPLFLIFVLMGIALLLFTGPVEMDGHAITCRTPLGRHQLRWDEVERVEMDEAGQALVFHAGRKQLAVIGPAYWLGKHKKALSGLLEVELNRRQLPLEYNPRAVFALSRHTRVK